MSDLARQSRDVYRRGGVAVLVHFSTAGLAGSLFPANFWLRSLSFSPQPSGSNSPTRIISPYTSVHTQSCLPPANTQVSFTVTTISSSTRSNTHPLTHSRHDTLSPSLLCARRDRLLLLLCSCVPGLSSQCPSRRRVQLAIDLVVDRKLIDGLIDSRTAPPLPYRQPTNSPSSS